MIYEVTIKGATPYMQHRMDNIKLQQWEKLRGNIIERDGLADEPHKTAAMHAYIDESGNYYLPAEHIKQCMINGGKFVKGKVGNSSRSMTNIVAGMFRIKEERLPLPKFDVVDSRSAVNNNVKARVMVYRPRWNEWEATFTLIVDEDDKNRITQETVEAIISYGGRYLGIGSYRPEHKGEFGRFTVEKMKLQK